MKSMSRSVKSRTGVALKTVSAVLLMLISSEDDTIDVSMLDEGHYVLLVRDLNSVFVYRQIIQISKI